MHPVPIRSRSGRGIRRVSPWLAAVILAGLAIIASGPGAAAAIHPAKATVHTREIDLAQYELGKGTVRCPAGKRVVSGGAAFHRPGLALAALSAKLISSSPTEDGKGWHAAGMSAEDLPIQMRITAVCRPKRSVGTYTVRTRDLTADGTLHFKGSLGCGRGKRIVTGGAFWNPRSGAPAPTGADNLFQSGPSADGLRWAASGFAFASPDDILRIVLLCRPTRTLGSVSIRTRDLTTGYYRGGWVSCPSGKRAIAGGVEWLTDGKAAPFDGFVTSSTVRSSRSGWYVAGATGPETIMRIRVVCIPK